MRLREFRTVAFLFTVSLVAITDVWAVPITGGTGPGGVGLTNGSSSLRLWLRGDQGVTTSGSDVTQWVDQSGNGSIIDPDAIANRPTYTGTQNGVPVVTFNPANPGAGTTQFLRADSFAIGGTGDATTYAAYKHNVGSIDANTQGLPFFGRTTNWFGLHANANNPTTLDAYTVGAAVAATVNGTTGGSFAEGTWGTIQGTHAAVEDVTPYTDLTFGSDAGSTGRLLNGDIGEVVIFNEALSTIEGTIIQNYISSKFNTLLAGSVDKYSGDTVGNGDYDYDVFGIGNDGTSSLTTSGSAGFGFEVTAGTVDSNEFMLAGHKVMSNTQLDLRWDRSWYLDNQLGGDEMLDFAFDWSDSGLGSANPEFTKLMFSSSDGGPFEPIANGLLIGDTVTFTGLTAGDLLNGYYTLGTTPPVPEPSSFLLLGLGALGLVRHTRRRRRA